MGVPPSPNRRNAESQPAFDLVRYESWRTFKVMITNSIALYSQVVNTSTLFEDVTTRRAVSMTRALQALRSAVTGNVWKEREPSGD